MDPKKKKGKGKTQVGLYDVEIMTDKELKDYIGVLIEENERVKLLIIESEKDKHEITTFLHNTNREILNRTGRLIEKNGVMQKQLDESLHRLKENKRENLVTELEVEMTDAKRNFKAFEKIQLAKAKQREEKQYLEKLLESVSREDEKSNTNEILVLFNEREKEEQQIVLKENNQNDIQIIAERCIQTYHDIIYDFQREKIEKIINVFESKVNKNTVEHSFSSYAEELAIYFEEILCKNLETTTTLKREVEKLENQLNDLKLHVKDAKRENKQLKLNKHYKNSVDSDIQTEGVADQTEVKVEIETAEENEAILYELIYENDVLNEKLRNTSKERDTLRKRFISGKRRIYLKSDFKCFLLEQMLLALQCKNIFPENATQYAILPKRKYHKDLPSVKDVPQSQLMIKGESK